MNSIKNINKILLATTNLGKIKEFYSLLQDNPYDITTPNKEEICLDVEENGTTFSENAFIKARFVNKIIFTYKLI